MPASSEPDLSAGYGSPDREFVRRPEVSVFGPTVGEYLEEWLARARVSVRESTWAAYRNAVGHLVDSLGGGSLRLLSALDVERFEHQLLMSGRSAKTVANVHSVLHRALSDAVRDGLVDRNVASLVSSPRAEQPEMTTWTVTELKQFLRSVEGHRLYAAFVVLATTGMRRGEVLGLQRVDVDLARAEVSVRRTVGVVDGRIEVGPPKSSSSRRLVALDTTTTAVLADHLEQRAGPVWVFPGEGDGPLNPASFSSTFDRLVARAGVPRSRVRRQLRCRGGDERVDDGDELVLPEVGRDVEGAVIGGPDHARRPRGGHDVHCPPLAAVVIERSRVRLTVEEKADRGVRDLRQVDRVGLPVDVDAQLHDPAREHSSSTERRPALRQVDAHRRIVGGHHLDRPAVVADGPFETSRLKTVPSGAVSAPAAVADRSNSIAETSSTEPRSVLSPPGERRARM
jgi:integrase